MARVQANGIEIEWEARGDPGAPAVLLIMGLGGQLTLWPDAFVDTLAGRGFHVIRFDNRHVGLSTKMDDAGTPNLAQIGMAMMTGMKPPAPYTLDDMAADAIGLLDALRIERAHIVGASMGGMIAQLVAATWPDRTLSLTSVMSTTGNPSLPQARGEATAMLMIRPGGTDIDSLVAHGIRTARAIGSPGFPAGEAQLTARVRANLERQNYPPGYARQLAAILASGDRRARLADSTVPTLVIHGADDPLVPVEGGRDTARSIPGARLIEIPGMGHDLPAALIEPIVDLIAEHALGAQVPA